MRDGVERLFKALFVVHSDALHVSMLSYSSPLGPMSHAPHYVGFFLVVFLRSTSAPGYLVTKLANVDPVLL